MADSLELRLGVMSIFAGAGLVVSGVKRLKKVRRIQDTGSINVASAPQGFVELQGFAWPMRPLKPFLTRDSAVFVDFLIEEKRGSGKNVKWVTVYASKSTEPFFLADDSGHVVVDPKDAEFDLRKTVKTWGDLTETQKNEFLALVGERSFLSNPLRFTEKVILAGSPLYALGTLRSAQAREKTMKPALGISLFLDKVNRFKRLPHGARRLLDLDQDGRICFEEWFRAYTSAAVASAVGFYGQTPLVLPKGMEHTSRCAGTIYAGPLHKLFLADCHQTELLERLGKWSAASIVGGAALIALGVVVAVGYFTGTIRLSYL